MSSSSTRERILELFRQQVGVYVSGEAICSQLGVSRTAVWKQIKVLREKGYRIEGVASRGYRLLEVSDQLHIETLANGLETTCIGRRLQVFATTPSTNREAHRLGEDGAIDGTVVIAEHQSAGRGRLGRHWQSPEGVNLYLSVLLRPPLPPRRAADLTFVSAVAVAETLERCCGVLCETKWPNDLLLGGKKVAGLLNEMHAEQEQIHYVVLGIGVNLNMTAEQFPRELRYPATSVVIETGKSVDRVDFTRELIRSLDRLYGVYLQKGAKPVLNAWEQRCTLINRRVRVSSGTEICGVATGVDSDGALLVVDAKGVEQRVLSGDVVPLEN